MAAELVALRGHFGVSATEALHGMPGWEYDLLTDAIAAGPDDDETGPVDLDDDDVGGPPPDPAVPAALRGMF